MEHITGVGTAGGPAADDLANETAGHVIMPRARGAQIAYTAADAPIVEMIQKTLERAHREMADEINARLAAAGRPLVDYLRPKPNGLDEALAQLHEKVRTADDAGFGDIGDRMRELLEQNRAAFASLSQTLAAFTADLRHAATAVVPARARKRSVTIRPDLDDAIHDIAGNRGYSEFVNDAVLMALQARGIDESLEDAAREYGPLTAADREIGRQRYAEAQARAAARTRAAAGGPQ